MGDGWVIAVLLLRPLQNTTEFNVVMLCARRMRLSKNTNKQEAQDKAVRTRRPQQQEALRHSIEMQFATIPELTPPPPPEAVSKTDKSVTLRTKLDAQPLDRKLSFQVVCVVVTSCA